MDAKDVLEDYSGASNYIIVAELQHTGSLSAGGFPVTTIEQINGYGHDIRLRYVYFSNWNTKHPKLFSLSIKTMIRQMIRQMIFFFLPSAPM